MTPRSTPPKLCHHKRSGRAYVTLDGEQRYLGDWGTPASRKAYDLLISQWFANGRTLELATDGRPPTDITVAELCLAFWQHAQKHYRKPDGTPTGEIAPMKSALRMLRRTHGETPAVEFGPLALKAVRESMITARWTRKNINRQVARIRQVFRWAVANEVASPSIITALEAVEPLLKGRSDAEDAEEVTPVDLAHVEAVKPFLSRQTWAMVQIQLLTGMRPGEVCVMRMKDIVVEADEKGAPRWRYAPAEHKTAHHGKLRVIYIGERGQEILRPFTDRPADAYLFSPREAEQERNATKRATRTTPMTPSHAGRRIRAATIGPRRPRGERYPVSSYGTAIARACERADAAAKAKLAAEGKEVPAVCVPSWAPNQLRHTAATRVRQAFGAEAASVMLGHSKLNTTLIYAPHNEQLQRTIAAAG